MATAKEIKEKAYLEDIYKELEGIKMKLSGLREDLARSYGKDTPTFITHDRHLLEMFEYIDWKLQVLEKGTSFDWKTAKGNRERIESDVSVLPPETATAPDISSGYFGG